MALRSQRRRVNQACSVCRRQKIRCDGNRPTCSTCQRRREHCTYKKYSPHEVQRDVEQSHHKPNPGLSEPLTTTSTTVNRSFEGFAAKAKNEDNSFGVTAMGLSSRSPKEDLSSMREYFGDSSAVAFIQQLQNTARLKSPRSMLESGCMQPHTPREADSGSSTEFQSLRSIMGSLPPRPLADHLVSCYFSKIHTLYPFIHQQAFMALYELMMAPEGAKHPPSNIKGIGLGDKSVKQSTFYFSLNAIFALGCQFSDVVQVEREVTSEAFFHLCKPALDLNYLERGDLALCQTLLLMSHYLQGSSTPNRCWHVIGTACRGAQALGLHSSAGDQSRSFVENQIRRRVWHGCVMLDLAASTILGRPVMISQTPLTPKPEAIDDCYLTTESAVCEQPVGIFSRVSWFIQTLKLYDILRDVFLTLYNNAELMDEARALHHKKAKRRPDIQFIAGIDAELQVFKENLPHELDWDLQVDSQTGDNFLREKLLLKARFSYLKLLLYRPVLSQMIRDNKSFPGGSNEIYHAGIFSKYSLDCSMFCVLAAMDLASLVHQTCANEELSSVWCYSLFYTFTAGSVIILAELSPPIANGVTRQALEESWEKCYASFAHLKSYNVAAERCARSLSMIRSRCLEAVLGDDSFHTADIFPNQGSKGDTSIRIETGAEMPFSEDLFGDLRFDDDTFLDPYWFDLQF